LPPTTLGARIAGSKKTPASCTVTMMSPWNRLMEVNRMECPNCGKEFEDADMKEPNTCPHCGRRLPREKE